MKFRRDSFMIYHYNRQKMKISYSTMPNMKRIIAGHNRKILNPENQLKREDCDGKGGCKDKCIEEEKSCQTKQIIYQAELKYEEPHHSIPNQSAPVTKKYIGLSKNKFRERYNHHKWSFSNEDNNPFNPAGRKDKAQNTTLSSHIWKLKKKRIEFNMRWRIINQAPVYSKESGSCQLCQEEKYQIMFADRTESLNKRTEIFSKCRHREEHLLGNLLKTK